MNSVKLSVVVITFNEEKNIGRCIDSMIQVADEFIILDSFSTDSTVRIIRDKGLDVIQHEWQGFSNSKNAANARATGDFILSIDADEELSPDLIRSIQQFKADPPAEVCELNRLTNYCGQWIRHSGWYPEFKIRIFRRGVAEWRGDIHEELVFTKDYTTMRLNGDLLHYSYPTVDSHLKKVFSYAQLAAQRDFASGKRYTVLGNGLVKPWFMFVRKYFFKLGLLDGYYGFVIAMISAFERFMRFVYYRQIAKKPNK
jgi:glycosyltransferase involved in cell wall biosynthesis